MSLLKNVNTDKDVQDAVDSLGGAGLLESGLYELEVKLAWLEKKTSGALFLNTVFNTADGREYKENLCITSGDNKGNKTYYETNGEKKPLPGFAIANALTMLTVEKEITDMDTEEKTIKVYDFDAKAEVPKKAEVLVELIGKKVIAGIQKVTVDKQAKNDKGDYVNTGETRDINEIDKLFHSELKVTVAEAKAGSKEPAFYEAWNAKWTGNTRNKAKGADGKAGAPAAAGGTPAPKKSLFDK